MSLEAQYRAVYQLLYKRWIRDAWGQAKFERFDGLDDAENAQIHALDLARLEAVVRLHANDIGNNWYNPRFPASWIALQVALDCDQAELTRRLTNSDEFELRENDDADGRALAAFVQKLADSKPRKPPNQPKPQPPLHRAPWLPELLRYERLIRGHWPDANNPRLETFEWDVGGLIDALLDKQLFPVDEKPAPLHMLLHRDHVGVTEIALSPDQARVMGKLLSRKSTKDEPAKLVAKCRRVLNQLKT